MAPRPTAERPPSGLDSYWTHTWDHALKVLREQGTWEWEQKPLLDEYVFALKCAEDAREGFGWLDALEKYADEAEDLPEIAWTVLQRISGNLPVVWDRHVKRATALADQLLLTPRSRKAHGLYDPVDEDEEPRDGFEALDELAPRRDRSQAA